MDLAFQRLQSFKWPIARYEFEWEVTSPIQFPDYAGSAIRGAFGKALRKTACMTHMPKCRSCPLFRSCPYTAIFETPAPVNHTLQKFSQIPSPYVIEAPDWGRRTYEAGETFSFSVVLIGQAIYHLALVIYSLKRAFSFEVAHGSAQLMTVKHCSQFGDKTIVYGGEFSEIQDHSASLDFDSLLSNDHSVALRFITPLRLQENGVGLSPQRITAQNLLMTLTRRVSLLMELQAKHNLDLPFSEIKASLDEVEISKQLHWQDWIRYSNRQQQKMHLGGVLGDIVINDLHPLMHLLLAVGQYTHVGKNAVFGLGRYIVI